MTLGSGKVSFSSNVDDYSHLNTNNHVTQQSNTAIKDLLYKIEKKTSVNSNFGFSTGIHNCIANIFNRKRKACLKILKEQLSGQLEDIASLTTQKHLPKSIKAELQKIQFQSQYLPSKNARENIKKQKDLIGIFANLYYTLDFAFSQSKLLNDQGVMEFTYRIENSFEAVNAFSTIVNIFNSGNINHYTIKISEKQKEKFKNLQKFFKQKGMPVFEIKNNKIENFDKWIGVCIDYLNSLYQSEENIPPIKPEFTEEVKNFSGNKVGEGNFGTVYKSIINGKTYALKEIKNSEEIKILQDFQKEKINKLSNQIVKDLYRDSTAEQKSIRHTIGDVVLEVEIKPATQIAQKNARKQSRKKQQIALKNEVNSLFDRINENPSFKKEIVNFEGKAFELTVKLKQEEREVINNNALCSTLNSLSRSQDEFAHITNFYGVIEQTNGSKILVYEFNEGLGLEKIFSPNNRELEKSEKFKRISSKLKTTEGKLEVIAQMAHGIAELYDAGIVHRDVKLENMIIDIDKNNKLFVKQIDLGESYYIPKANSKVTNETTIGEEKGKGSPSYQAPEICSKEDSSSNKGVDVWALGISILEVLGGCRACQQGFPLPWMISEFVTDEISKYKTMEELFTKISGASAWKHYLSCFDEDDINEKFSELIFSCLNNDPKERASISDVIKNINDIIKMCNGRKNVNGIGIVNIDVEKFKTYEDDFSPSAMIAKMTNGHFKDLTDAMYYVNKGSSPNEYSILTELYKFDFNENSGFSSSVDIDEKLEQNDAKEMFRRAGISIEDSIENKTNETIITENNNNKINQTYGTDFQLVSYDIDD